MHLDLGNTCQPERRGQVLPSIDRCDKPTDMLLFRCIVDYADALRSGFCLSLSEHLLDVSYGVNIGCVEFCPEELLYHILLLHYIPDDEGLCTH